MNENIYTDLGRLLSDQCDHTINLAVFSGTEKVNFQNRYECTGSLLKQVQDCYDYLQRYNNLRSTFQGILRTDKRDYSEEALKEILINTVIYRDYAYNSPVLIHIFDDRMEFISVGKLVKGMTLEEMMLGRSMMRNKNLSSIFKQLGFLKTDDSEILKTLCSYNSCAVKPQLEISDNAFKITLPNRNI